MSARFLMLLPLLAACGGDAQPDSDTPAGDSTVTASVVAPRFDTLMTSSDMRCANGTEVRANVYVGSEPRLVLATQDTGMALALREAATGRRYASADGRVEWWVRGDTATLTLRGATTTCAPASDVEF